MICVILFEAQREVRLRDPADVTDFGAWQAPRSEGPRLPIEPCDGNPSGVDRDYPALHPLADEQGPRVGDPQAAAFVRKVIELCGDGRLRLSRGRSPRSQFGNGSPGLAIRI